MSRYVIDKSKLEENIKIIKEKAKVPIIAVVKGNGYGFGMAEFTKILLENGINTFAVTEISDLPILREILKDEEIIVLRSTCVKSECEIIAKYDATAVIGSLNAAQVMNEVAKEMGKTVKCNLKIDTGMGRYGFMPNEINEAVKCYEMENLEFVGAYTHFPCAFEQNGPTKAQLEIFKDVMKQIESKVGSVGTLHCANSPALFNFDNVSLGAVRIGSAFTGRIITHKSSGLNRIGMLEAEVIETKTVPSGYSIGYGATYKTKCETTLAVIPFGHYDGFGITVQREEHNLRSVLSALKSFLKKERIYVTINDKKYPVVGSIGLDHCTVDITGSDVKIGDVAQADISPLMVNPRIERVYK